MRYLWIGIVKITVLRCARGGKARTADTYTYTQDECPCRTWLPLDPMRTNHEDEAIVFDVITQVAHRCRLCGRKFTTCRSARLYSQWGVQVGEPTLDHATPSSIA